MENINKIDDGQIPMKTERILWEVKEIGGKEDSVESVDC